ncbi:hypothetical protein H4219_002443 [Mycoemilia scoparia]|uniref:Uncharacterized protein n=1 Tax=Mycoemilia scoparia TaxID=417184 RepID=A0A9W8A3C5_9FUNG|nr:hypothetical protein H4219_002443 [Mycoemilia scoparia]
MAQGAGPDKISTRKSGAKKGAQKYQNKEAYKHNRNSKRTKEILALPVDGLCKHCTEIILWRKQFRKYKPLTAPKRCVGCDQKAIKKAYHVLCDDCAAKKHVCAKCTKPEEIVQHENIKTPEEIQSEKQELEGKLARLRERERRTYLRKLERGEIDASEVPDVGDDYDSFDDDFSDSDIDNK